MKIAMKDIARATAAHYELKAGELISASRCARVAKPRQLAMLICYEETGRSYPDIADFFNRDHSTAVHAVQKLKGAYGQSAAIQAAKASIIGLAASFAAIRTTQEQKWVRHLHAGDVFAPPPGTMVTTKVLEPVPAKQMAAIAEAVARRILVPTRCRTRPRKSPRALPSDLTPPTQARLMSARA